MLRWRRLASEPNHTWTIGFASCSQALFFLTLFSPAAFCKLLSELTIFIIERWGQGARHIIWLSNLDTKGRRLKDECTLLPGQRYGKSEKPLSSVSAFGMILVAGNVLRASMVILSCECIEFSAYGRIQYLFFHTMYLWPKGKKTNKPRIRMLILYK